MEKRTQFPIAALLLPFLLSGAAALSAQLCWLRQLTVTLGSSAAALNIILITFMGGLAIGSRLAERACKCTTRYLLLYAGLEGGLALYLICSPAIFSFTSALFIDFLPTLGHETLAAQMARVAVTGLVLLPPTIAMGMTAPVLITATVRQFRQAASYTGLLYGVNTLGASLGAIVTGTYLILRFGITMSLRMAAGMNMLAASAAILIVIVACRPTGVIGLQPAAEGPAKSGRDVKHTPVLKYGLLAAGGGFVGMGLEIIFARFLVFIIGSSYYSHTICITGFLLGIVAGSLLVALVARRFELRESFLPYLFIFAGFSAAVSAVLFFNHFPLAAQRYLYMMGIIDLHPLAIKLTTALILVVLPAMASGMILPLLVHLLIKKTRNVSVGSSRIFFYNTVGSVVGVALVGYVLIELLGVLNALFLITLLSFLLALYSMTLSSPSRRIPRILPFGIAILGILTTSGLFLMTNDTPLVVHSTVYTMLEDPELVFYREDEGASVSAVILPQEEKMMLLINGLRAARLSRDTGRGDLSLATDVAMLSHSDPRTAFFAGLGTGRNAGAAGLYPGVKIDALEISDAVISALPYFDEYTYNVSKNDHIKVILGDARHFLQATGKRYDLIVPDAYISALTGTAYLYNVEFFQLCARHLSPGGRVVMQIDVNSGIDRTIAAGFLIAFPYVELVRSPTLGSHYLVASNEEISFPSLPVAKWYNHDEINKRIQLLGFAESEKMSLRRFSSNAELIEEFKGAKASTDDHPIVDYISAYWK